MKTEIPASYNELKAHYLAVKKRLGGLGPSAGLVPMNAVRPKLPEPEPEQIVIEQVEEPETRVITWTVKGMPKNNFFRILIDVARKHNIDPNKIIEPNRRTEMVKIRREVVWRTITEAGYSRAQVGRWLKRDHTTIIHDLHCWERDNVARS